MELVMDGSFTNVLFRVVPPSCRKPYAYGETVDRTDAERFRIGKTQPRVKKQMQRLGQALIGFQEYGTEQDGTKEVNFFRLVVAQGDELTPELLDHTFEIMIDHAADPDDGSAPAAAPHDARETVHSR